MRDPVEVRRRMECLIDRVERRDDYGRLLVCGKVVRRLEELDDAGAWRAQLRRQARADRISIRTGHGSGVVWAFLAEGDTPARMDENRRIGELLEALVPPAVEHNHEPSLLLRQGAEVILHCNRCPALAYGNADEGFTGGALLEHDCPGDEPPTITALALMRVGRADG